MAHDKAAGPRLTNKSPNQAHIALVDMLAKTLNLSRLEVIMRAVRLLAAEVERDATTAKGDATHAS